MLDLRGYGWMLWQGLELTILVGLGAMALALVLGLLGAWGKLARGRTGRWVAGTYTTVIRGVPELLLILLVYYGVPTLIQDIAEDAGHDIIIDINPFIAGVITIGFIYGAFATEVFRGAFLAVPRGQIEAARAIGMGRALTFRRIVMPQMWRFALPGLGNVWMVLIKATALISVIPARGADAQRGHRGARDQAAIHLLLRRLALLSRHHRRLDGGAAACRGVGQPRRATRLRPAMDLAIIWESLPRLLDGATLTLEITVVSLVVGLTLAVPLAIMRLSPNPVLWMPVYGYILYFRGTPLLVQLFLVYYGSGQFRPFLDQIGLWVLFREAYFCAVLTLTLNTTAYTAEILRGAIQGVPRGDIEAARALGMSGTLLYRRIVLPKAFRIALPAYTNEVVFLLQATSLISIITLLDLTGVARIIVARSFEPYKLYITAGLIYLAMSYFFILLSRFIEHRLSGHMRERPASGRALR